MYQLDILAQHRDDLLKAEVAGWVHDYRKCSDEHLRVKAANLTNQQALPRNQLVQHFSNLQTIPISILGASRTFADLLDDQTWSNDVLGQFLSRCHKTAHFDKQEPVDGKQNYPKIKISTPFGFENDVPSPSLTAQLWRLPWNSVSDCTANRSGPIQAMSALFTQTVADTRRPINEVDLWNWGLLVGALYKAALAGALLKGVTPAAQDLRWRLLAIQVNGLDYLINVMRVPDVLARQQLLTDALNRVREMLEVTYPLGSEVYRDENGSIYVVPDVTDLLNAIDPHNRTLGTIIRETFASGMDGEIVPSIDLERNSWWGQDPNWPASSNDELPDIGGFLLRSVSSLPDIQRIQQFWSSNQNDICTVCGLRPQGKSAKAKDRGVCDICEDRRAERSREWVTSQSDRTIWIDEVQDANGRYALVIGAFEIEWWLNGHLVQSLLVIAPDNHPATGKTASFSRLRRIWETTRTFWREVQTDIAAHLTDDRRRLRIFLSNQPDLAPYHVYDLVVGSTDMSVVWVPPYGGIPGYLLSADNFGFIARQLKAERAIYSHPATAAIFVEEYLKQQFIQDHNQPILRNPDGGISMQNLLSGIYIQNVVYQQHRYATFIPLLAEPRVFLALVPADRALEVVGAIKTKYEREMGKVRNRLPLHLGVVFAPWRAPLRAVLDAGRQMLRQRASAQGWEVVCCARKTVNKGDLLPSRFYLTEQGTLTAWFEVTLKNADHRDVAHSRSHGRWADRRPVVSVCVPRRERRTDRPHPSFPGAQSVERARRLAGPCFRTATRRSGLFHPVHL
ncbi:MAG: CRISPR-associated protein Csx11 [Roseiflexaceae bacterium]|nr:CRISPR-associated protein Csx11 [Roseiflexaceae bacterium]